MPIRAYYNDNDRFAAAWLRNLIAAKLIADGDVDERDIREVKSKELTEYTQCHFFAGIGVWSYALRQAGWPDTRPVWTGSCPCSPFSIAGQHKSTKDDRHLWPEFFRLIEESHPDVVFGEQVASKDGLAWFDTVQADMEGEAYAIGVADLCAAGFGAPHIRQRLYFVADAKWGRSEQWNEGFGKFQQSDTHCSAGNVGESGVEGLEGHTGNEHHGSEPGRVEPKSGGPASAPSYVGGFWKNAEWIECRDGKRRPIEPGTFPLAYGASARVGRLRGYGNALVAPQAQAFIEAYMEIQ